MKNYEKPMAIVNKFEVEDVIAASVTTATASQLEQVMGSAYTTGAQGVIFQW